MYNGAPLDLINEGFPKNLVRFKGTMLCGDPSVYADDIDNFEIFDDDVWLCGFMRSGTHWAKEMIWRVANGLSFNNTELLRERFPCFDMLIAKQCLFHLTKRYDDILLKLRSVPSPRFLKTHLPFHLLPKQLRSGEKNAKIIYISRNPKDLCVSLYHFYKHFHNFQGTLEEMCDLVIKDKVQRAPYWPNVLSFWEKREDFNILFIKYEDMIHDLPSVLHKTATFFGKQLTDDEVSALSAHLSFENFSKDPALTDEHIDEVYTKKFEHRNSKGFVRKGTVGQWKQEMTAATAQRLDDWIEKNLQNSDYKI